VLLAPSARAMRKLLLVCDEFAGNYSVKFNSNKSKCLTFRSTRGRRVNSVELPDFVIGGSLIENVEQWPHLGHLIDSHLSDDEDIVSRRNSLVGQVNNFLCYFSKLDVSLRNRLFKVYCSSFYGCEIWDLYNNKIDELCIAWRKGVRRVWALPGNTGCDILHLITDTIPVYDEICRRVSNFIFACCESGSQLVKYVVNFGINYSHTSSPIGRNALLCSLRYNVSVQDVCTKRLPYILFKQFFYSHLDSDSFSRARCAVELIMIRDNYLVVPGIHISVDDSNCILRELIT
jgi:hypothetical protein